MHVVRSFIPVSWGLGSLPEVPFSGTPSFDGFYLRASIRMMEANKFIRTSVHFYHPARRHITRKKIFFFMPRELGMSFVSFYFVGLKSRYICVIKTNLIHHVSSVYVVGQPVHVSGIFVAHILYTGCNRREGPYFGRVFLMLNYTEKPQNTYIQS